MEENQSQPAVKPVEEQATASVVPAQSEVSQPARGKKKLWTIVTIVIVLVLAGAGYTAYAQLYQPNHVWQKFISQPLNSKILSESFDFSYQDNGQVPAGSNDQFMGMLTNLKVALNGTAYEDVADIKNPQISMGVNYSFGSGDTSISTKANIVMLGQDLYINFGDNPLINTLLSFVSPDKKIDWIKINAKEIQEASGTTTPAVSIDYAKQAADYQAAIQKYLPLVIVKDKLIDRPTVRGVPTLHYSVMLDKTQAKAMMHALADVMVSQLQSESSLPATESLSDIKDTAYTVVDTILDRIQISDFEAWIGANDYQLHEVKYTASVPSFVSLFSVASKDSEALTNMSPSAVASKILGETSFDGVMKMDQQIYDIGKKQDVTAPANAFDLAQKIKDEKQKESANQVPANAFPVNCPNCGVSK